MFFQGAPNVFCCVQVGTPEASPVSPLLFVIYVSILHLPILCGLIFSYIHDFTITLGSLSYSSNCQIFQHVFHMQRWRATGLAVSLSVPKIELCHWRTPRTDLYLPQMLWPLMGPSVIPPPLFNGCVSLHYCRLPLTIARDWYWAMCLWYCQTAFPSQTWPVALCQPGLSSSLILPILSYGADLFTPSTTIQDKMTVFWNKVFRWVTNCFYSTHVNILPFKACLLPLDFHLPHKSRLATLRPVCCSPHINPTASRLPASFP